MIWWLFSTGGGYGCGFVGECVWDILEGSERERVCVGE